MYTEQQLENELKKSTFIDIMADNLCNTQYEDEDNVADFDLLFEVCFDTDYPIIGYYWANEALKKYKGATADGVFGAIHDCKAYLDSQGLLDTVDRLPWQDTPEDLLAMLVYCAGDYYFSETLDRADLCISDLVRENASEFEKALESIRQDNTVDFVEHVHGFLD